LGLRLVLALFGLVMCAGGAALLLTTGWAPGIAVFLGGLAVVALIDVAVIVRRRQRERAR